MSELMLTPVFSVSEQRVIRRAMRLLDCEICATAQCRSSDPCA